MSYMRVVLRATGMTAAILSFSSLLFAQTRVPIPSGSSTQPPAAVSPDAPLLPDAPPVTTVKKRSFFKRMFGVQDKLTAAPTPVGIQVLMSDGSIKTFSLGTWLTYAPYSSACSPSCPPGTGQIRGLFPTQYVNQIATIQPDGSWKYTRPGRNVQVWRNGLLQRQGPDYTLDQANATIIPVKYPGPNGTPEGWSTDDYVTVAYLY